MNETFEQINQLVEEELRENFKARNSDKHLILGVLKRLGYSFDFTDEEINSMPSFETIRRTRQLIQNQDGKYPATEKVEEERKKNREDFHLKFSKRGSAFTSHNSYLMSD